MHFSGEHDRYLQAGGSNLCLLVRPQGTGQVVYLRIVTVDWCSVVGVCEDDLLCQAAHVTIAKPLSQHPAAKHRRHLLPKENRRRN